MFSFFTLQIPCVYIMTFLLKPVCILLRDRNRFLKDNNKIKYNMGKHNLPD